MVFRICVSATVIMFLLVIGAFAQIDDNGYIPDKILFYKSGKVVYKLKCKFKHTDGTRKPLLILTIKNTIDKIPYVLKFEPQGYGNSNMVEPDNKTIRYDKGTNKSLRVKFKNNKTKLEFVYKTVSGFPANYTQAIFLDGDEQFNWCFQSAGNINEHDNESVFYPEYEGAYILFPKTGMNVPVLALMPLEAVDNLGNSSPVTMEYKSDTKKLLLKYNQTFFDGASLPIVVKAKVL